jgi:hypothetical protein
MSIKYFRKSTGIKSLFKTGIFSFLLSCSQPTLPEKSLEQKLEAHLEQFSKDWQNENNRFFMDLNKLSVQFNDQNSSIGNAIATYSFPVNWTEFQYQEESDFAQGYDAVIQVQSNVFVEHSYQDGNWTFTSAKQLDFNTTIIEVADDYSKIIADAWIKRLPKEKVFTKKLKLFSKIPPNKDY